jgi:uncharacterized BrkB/YihY/UPF0761 family membrane protein
MKHRIRMLNLVRAVALCLALSLVGYAQQAADGQKPGPQTTAQVQLTPQEILWLSILATVGLVLMWGLFWLAVARSKESIREVLQGAAFFRTVAVMGVIASTVVLSLAGRLDGNITGAILSGIVGYVLGQLSGPARTPTEKEQH